VDEHRQAASDAASLFLVKLPKEADVVITSASPLEIGVQATKALLNARLAVKTGGTIIWVASQKQAGPLMALIEQMAAAKSANDYHRRLLKGDIPDAVKPFGISFLSGGRLSCCAGFSGFLGRQKLNDGFIPLGVTADFGRDRGLVFHGFP
jgi:hypothetical protein